jgi:hypothetical protein
MMEDRVAMAVQAEPFTAKVALLSSPPRWREMVQAPAPPGDVAVLVAVQAERVGREGTVAVFTALIHFNQSQVPTPAIPPGPAATEVKAVQEAWD